MKIARWVLSCAVVGGLIHGQAALSIGQYGDEGAAPTAEAMTAEQAPAGREVAKRPACQCIGENASPIVEEIKQALAAPIHETGMEFTETPLSNVIAYLQDEYKIPIRLDVPALEDAGLSQDEPVNIQLHRISFKSALRNMLRQSKLTYLISDEVLLITTPQVAETQLKTCIYDIRDLIGMNNQKEDTQELITAITSTVNPTSWAEHGGGEAKVTSLRRGMLVVSQTSAIQDEICELLAAIRRVPARTDEPTLADATNTAGRGPFRGLPPGFGRAAIGFGGMGESGYGGREYGGEGGESGGRDAIGIPGIGGGEPAAEPGIGGYRDQ